jgi:hypothetical protein
MAWVRLDDQFPDHPKVAGLSNDAFCLHVTAMCYTARQQTDGKLPCGLLKRLAWRCHDPAIAVAELVASGVWDEDGEKGWAIHDYLDYNPSKAELDTLAATRSEAGKAGAMARWQKDGKQHGKSHSKQHGKIMPHTPSPSPSERERGTHTPPPLDPFSEQSPEFKEALRKLDAQWPGAVTGTVQLKLTRIWDQLTNGKAAWLDDAILEAVARNGQTPDYALQVLATSLRSGKRPGEMMATKRGGYDKDAEYKRKMEALLGD